MDDETRFRTLHQFPILDAHPPIQKKVRDHDAISAENPEGLVEMTLEVTEEDLETLAANSNRRVAMGRPPVLQIGHTPLEDRPEAFQPRPVGMTSHYTVCRRDGKPWLCCDLHYRADRFDEASTYPNLSVERVDWRDPSAHMIEAVSLLRRRPERDVPLVPYEAGATASLRACYSRDLPTPRPVGPFAARAKAAADRQKRIDMMLRYDLNHADASRHVAAGSTPDGSLLRYKATLKPRAPVLDEATRRARLEFMTRHGITDHAEGVRRFNAARAKREA